MLAEDVHLRDRHISVFGKAEAIRETVKNFAEAESIEIHILALYESTDTVAGELHIGVDGKIDLYLVDAGTFKARVPESNNVRMMAWSRLVVGRRIANLRRMNVSASREHVQTLSMRVISSCVKGSTSTFWNFGAGTLFIGFSIRNSSFAHVKKAHSEIQIFRNDFGESARISPPNRRGTYSVRM